MPGFRTLGLSLVLSCGLLSGCGLDPQAEPPSSLAGSGGSAGVAATPTSLEFEGLGENATLTIAPSQTRTLRVLVHPAGIYQVRFGLFGEAGDASLDRNQAETDSDGVAEVTLTAPETVKLFSVRASIGTTLETRAVIAVAKSFATLQVQPNYSGKRPIVYWVASANFGTTCKALPTDPADGDLVDQALPGDPDEPQYPTITSVPIGIGTQTPTQWAVTLRAARYIQGCADVSNLVPDKVNELVVPVRDVPLKISGGDLDLVLRIDPATANLGPLLDKAEALMFERLSKGQLSDVGMLLDAMADATDPVQTSGFVSERSRGQWDLWLPVALGLGASTELRRPLRGWFATAREQILEREMLSGRLLTTNLSADSAELRLNRTFGYDPIAAGFSPALGTRLSVTAEADDNLVVGGTLQWFPTQLLGRFVTDVASAAGIGASSVPEALVSELSCDRVAAELADHGTDSSQVFPGCNLGCATELCKTAVQNLWKRMIDVTDTEPASLVLSATGGAQVDDHANVASVKNGAWSANVDFASVTGKLTGGLEATGVLRPPPAQ